MKYCLILILIFYETSFNKVNFNINSDVPLIQAFNSFQMGPIYFIHPVQEKIKLLDRVDLSFMKSSIIVFYRYKLEIPDGAGTTIDRKLIIWSPWAKDDLTKIIIPRLDIIGGYKLIVEYKTNPNDETKKFEKPFIVYGVNPEAKAEIVRSNTANVFERTKANPAAGDDRILAKTQHETDRIAVKTAPATIIAVTKPASLPDKPAVKTSPVTDKAVIKTNNEKKDKSTTEAPSVSKNRTREREVINKNRVEKIDVKILAEKIPKIISSSMDLTGGTSKKPAAIEKNTKSENDTLLAEAVMKKDSDNLNLPKSISIRSIINTTSDKRNPKFEFNLPYDNELVRKRQFMKTVQIISVPLFILSGTGSIFLKSRADKYYSLSKIAETEDKARGYYEKTSRFDKYTYISCGVSVVSAFGFIHSTIRRKSISRKMFKELNYK